MKKPARGWPKYLQNVHNGHVFKGAREDSPKRLIGLIVWCKNGPCDSIGCRLTVMKADVKPVGKKLIERMVLDRVIE